MLFRWLLILCKWTGIHTVVSGLFLLFAIGAMAQPDWLFVPLFWIFFFPMAFAEKVGFLVDPWENPLNLLFNSVCWVAVVYPLWLSYRGSRLRRTIRAGITNLIQGCRQLEQLKAPARSQD